MIKIICVGKVKEKYFRDAIEEYIKRLSKYTKLKIIEVEDIDNPCVDNVLNHEKEQILKHIGDRDYIVTLEIEGEQLTSVELSNRINKIFTNFSNITFIIGGSYGLSKQIKELSNCRLSFSKMTFPHQLFRLIFVEQLYRAYRIINNESYHK